MIIRLLMMMEYDNRRSLSLDKGICVTGLQVFVQAIGIPYIQKKSK
jgi:hypothetical protein